ncbi:MAG: tetratricopeptide repeat protein [Candidatus Krumholzibacteriota bacterium]|nr:tetratricopeptide repeat protein [Candidatus Krumholzibacteriota bacterium]
MIGKIVSHYKILDKIGEGGMGDVYKARDLKLDRLVALKFLTREMKFDHEALTRFHHEAKAASALDHVNIATIYEIDETPDGQMFIAMAFYEGLTLKEMMGQKPPGVNNTVDLAIQVSRGLSKAHKAGIIHRDIKPANVIVTAEGIVKIIDFGLAKLAGSTKVTKTGITTGTVAYMSPEQARGEEVSPRTDIFSLGIVLYEMLAGIHPFRGDYDMAVMHSILYDEPEPVTNHNPEIPADLRDIVHRALAKEPDKRYQDASQLAAALNEFKANAKNLGETSSKNLGEASSKKMKGRKGSFAAVITIAAILLVTAGYTLYSRYFTKGARPSFWRRLEAVFEDSRKASKTEEEPLAIAVTPFWGQNEAAADEGLVIQKLLLRELAAIMGPGESANIIAVDPARVPRSHAEAMTLGRDQKALLVIWGDVLIYEGEIEIQPNISIIKPLKDFEEPSPEAFNFMLSDRDQLKLRKEKAGEVGKTALYTAARYYRDNNPGRALSLVEKLPESDPERFLLQGSILTGLGKTDEAALAYQKASELAPESSRPHLYLGDLYSLYLQRFGEADAEYKKAVELEPDSPWTRLALANFYLAFDNKRELALREIDKVIETGTADASIYSYTGHLYKSAGRYDAAIEQYRKAINLSPGSADIICSLGDAYEKSGAIDKAIAEYQRAGGIAPAGGGPWYLLGNCYFRQQRYGEALEQYKKAAALAPDDFPTYFALGNTYAKLGDRKKAVKYFNQAFNCSKEIFEWLSYLFMGINYLQLEMYDEAAAEFQKGIVSGYYLDQFHYYSGYACERMDRFEAALDEYEKGVEAERQDSLKTGIQNHIHCFLSLCRFDRQDEARSFILDLSEKLSDVEWKWFSETERAVLDFYLGRTLVQDLLKLQEGIESPVDAKHQRCLLNYYIALSFVINISPDPSSTSINQENAREYLEKCVDFCAGYEDPTFYGRVEMELERLDQKR